MGRRSILLLCALLMTLTGGLGCGVKNKGDNKQQSVLPNGSLGVQALFGQWTAEELTARGERYIITFNPPLKEGDEAKDLSFDVAAILASGQSFPVVVGMYSADNEEITFTYPDGSTSTSPFLTSQTQLVLDEEDVYHRFDPATVPGGHLVGQIRMDDGTGQPVPDTAITVSSAGGSPYTGPQSVPGDILVKYKSGMGPSSLSALSLVSPVTGEKKALPPHTVKASVGYHKINIKRSQPTLQGMAVLPKFQQVMNSFTELNEITDEVLEELNRRSDVEYAHRNWYLSAASVDDPGYSQQWYLNMINWLGAMAVNNGTPVGGGDVVVAVLDSGIIGHPDLSGKLLPGYDFISDPNSSADGDARDPNPVDNGACDLTDNPTCSSTSLSSFHGTHVAGSIGAIANNGVGIAGVNPQVKVMPVRVLGRFNGTVEDIAQAIYYAAGLANDSGTVPVQRAHVINMSLGGNPGDPAKIQALQEAINAAHAAGSIMVAAAGNCHLDLSTCGDTFYPAGSNHVLSIGSVKADGSFASLYSKHSNYQFLVAPGGSGGSVDENQILSLTIGNGMSWLFGTSQSAPLVSGVVSLMLAANPDLRDGSEADVNVVKNCLKTTAIDMGDAGYDAYYGWGLVNARDAVLCAMGLDSLVGAPSLGVSAQNVNAGAFSNEIVIQAYNQGGGTINGIAVTPSTNEGGNWLSVDVGSSSDPALIRINIDRTDLTGGEYTGELQVTSANAGSKTINVSMKVAYGLSGELGELDQKLQDLIDLIEANGGELYQNQVDVGNVIVLLLDYETDNYKYGLKTNFANNYFYGFVGVEPGTYKVVAGMDLNNDGEICTEDEPCNAWPDLSNPMAIQVEEDTRLYDIFIPF